MRARSWLWSLSLAAACSGDGKAGGDPVVIVNGLAKIELTIANGVSLDDVGYTVTGDEISPVNGTFLTLSGKSYQVAVIGLPPGDDYVVSVSASVPDAGAPCSASQSFDVRGNTTSYVQLVLECGASTHNDAAVQYDGGAAVDAGDAQPDAATPPPQQTDAAAPRDGGSLVDASLPAVDAGAVPDASLAVVDAGAVPDASVPIVDAAAPDAAVDASVVDAATDAQVQDADVADAAVDAAVEDASTHAGGDAGDGCVLCYQGKCVVVHGIDCHPTP